MKKNKDFEKKKEKMRLEKRKIITIGRRQWLTDDGQSMTDEGGRWQTFSGFLAEKREKNREREEEETQWGLK